MKGKSSLQIFSFCNIIPSTSTIDAKVNVVAMDKLPGQVHDPLECQNSPLTGQNGDHKQGLDLHQLLLSDLLQVWRQLIHDLESAKRLGI